jgi:HprK-related kinase B
MITSADSICELADNILSNYSLDHALSLDFGDCRITVRTSDSEIVKQLSEYFKVFLCNEREANIYIIAIESAPPEFKQEFIIKQPDPCKTKIKDE